MASPAQKYRFNGLPALAAENVEQLDEMLEDLYSYLAQSPLGTGSAAFDLSELVTTPGVLYADASRALASLGTVGSVYIATTGVPSALSAATGNALISGGVGAAPSFGKIALTTHVSGVLPLANGGTGSSAFTAGSVPFSNGTLLTQDNANFFWDAGSLRLGLGTASPTTMLHLKSTGTVELRLESDTDNVDESHQARILMSQDGALVTARIGFTSGSNSLEMRTDQSGSGGHGDIVFAPNNVIQATMYPSGGISFLGTSSDPGAGIFRVDGQVKITGGTPAAGQVLTSDANGLATWEPAAGGSATEQTTTSTGTQNDFSLSASNTTLRCNNATDLTLTGFTIGGVAPAAGAIVTIVSVGAGNVFFSHQTGSTAAYRLINTVTSGGTPLAAGTGTATYVYDDTTDRWRLVSHKQGAFITPAFSAGDYTAGGTQTWTLASGDVSSFAYLLEGKALTLQWSLINTTIGGTPDADLRRVLPNSFTVAATCGSFYSFNNAGTTGVGEILFSTSANTLMTFRRAILSGGTNWTGGTDNSDMRGMAKVEVT